MSSVTDVPTDLPSPSLASSEEGELGALPEEVQGVARRLVRDYALVAPPDLVIRHVASAADGFADARVRTYVPVFVERAVRRALAASSD